MSAPTESEIKSAYSAYKSLTGLDVPYTMQLRFMFEAWLAAGFTEPDLACVVRYLKQKIKEGKRPKESLLPRNLIHRTDFFGEDCAIAKAEHRNSIKQTPRQSILRAAGRPETKEVQAVSASVVLERTKMAQMLKEWKEKEL